MALGANSSNALDFNAASLGSVSLGAIGSSTYSGTLTPAGSTYRLGGGGGTLTFSSQLTGANALAVSGPGTVVLTTTNTYSSGTSVNSGTLTMGDAAALGSGHTSIAPGATLNSSSYGFDLTKVSPRRSRLRSRPTQEAS